jgi:uncharacterized protein with PQ loop repeat
MEKPKYQIIAFISGIFTLFAFSNLVSRVHFTKNTEHLTYIWVASVLTAQSLLVIYGLLNNAYGIYIPATILVVGILYILYIKRTYEENAIIEKDLQQKNILIEQSMN